jgi:hypothetical protein
LDAILKLEQVKYAKGTIQAATVLSPTVHRLERLIDYRRNALSVRPGAIRGEKAGLPGQLTNTA